MQARGVTLTELLMVVVIIAILATAAIPGYRRAAERGYWRGAQDVLRTIYAGEQVYFTMNDQFLNNPTTLAQWREIYMDDPNVSSPMPVTFSVTAAGVGPGATFTASADRGGQVMTLNDLNTLCTGPPDSACGSWPLP